MCTAFQMHLATFMYHGNMSNTLSHWILILLSFTDASAYTDIVCNYISRYSKWYNILCKGRHTSELDRSSEILQGELCWSSQVNYWAIISVCWWIVNSEVIQKCNKTFLRLFLFLFICTIVFCHFWPLNSSISLSTHLLSLPFNCSFFSFLTITTNVFYVHSIFCFYVFYAHSWNVYSTVSPLSIRNQTENSIITNLANGSFVWIGLHREKLWSDGSTSLFRHWAVGQPNLSGEECVTTSFNDSGRWSDENCTFNFSFICFKTSNASYFYSYTI